jgi:hypothetical protein
MDPAGHELAFAHAQRHVVDDRRAAERFRQMGDLDDVGHGGPHRRADDRSSARQALR